MLMVTTIPVLLNLYNETAFKCSKEVSFEEFNSSVDSRLSYFLLLLDLSILMF